MANHQILVGNYPTLARLVLVCFLVGLPLVLGTGGTGATQDSAAYLPYISTSGSAPLPYPNCRYGTTTWGSDQWDWLPELGAGWFLYYWGDVQGLNGIEPIQIIWVQQNKDDDGNYLPGYWTRPELTDASLGTLIETNPGRLWIVGNEVDRGPDPGETTSSQGDTFPEVYALAYHDIYHFIKQHDPTAQVGVAGLVEVTPGRLQYLDLVWESYQVQFGSTMPVDVWNMHLYILPEARPDGQPNGVANIALGTDPTLAIRESGNDPAMCPDDRIYCWAEHDSISVFEEQIVAMRTWMKQHGQQNKPLILGEFSILYPFTNYDDPIDPTHCFLQDEYGNCFTQARVFQWMLNTFAFLESAVDPKLGYPPDGNRLVQQWNWYSVNTTRVGYVSNLVNDELAGLTQLGRLFRDSVAAQPTQVNLLPDQVAFPIGFSPTPTGTASVTLSVSVRNNGNTQVTAPFTVTFYSDSGLTQPIGSATIPSLGGCARAVASAATIWANLPTGLHPYWVWVDSPPVIEESHEGDNIAQGFVLVNPTQVFLPAAHR
jgi:hypothetical protein